MMSLQRNRSDMIFADTANKQTDVETAKVILEPAGCVLHLRLVKKQLVIRFELN